MLLQLHIKNVAVIDEVDISFEEGLNVLTGETGAGKSILIDAINMVLGGRISRDLIRSGEKKAVVEALYQFNTAVVGDLLETLGIKAEDDHTLVISREITTSGRSVCRVNGCMVNLSVLKDIGCLIVNIHGQHDNQALLQWENHIDFLDKYAGKQFLALKKEYRHMFEEVSSIKGQIRKMTGDERERERKIDLLKFQLEEINQAKLQRGEEEEIDRQRLLLGNAEKLMTVTSNAYDTLYAGTQAGVAVHDQLAEVLKSLGEVKQFDPKLEGYYIILEEVGYQLDELVHDLRDYRDQLEFDPDMLATLEQRMDLIYKLKRKYGSTIEEILAYRDRIQQEFEALSVSEETLKELGIRLEQYTKKLKSSAEALSRHRIEVAQNLQQKIMSELQDLDMAKTSFEVRIEKEYDQSGDYKFSQVGFDKVEFLISTNPGEPLKPLVKVASGGEMSRIMLAIKTVLADTDEVNTLIFDEIDMGVSGRAAQKIAEKLSLVAYQKQVLCITHLPQIASMADHHYLIEKNVIDDKSNTNVHKLSVQHRKKELARIIGGAVMTDLTLKNAEEMISIAEELKQTVKTMNN
ncbi:MAG: DNA repair protein RecN [Firmicutes bacterium]|nr:DNA repair protein RecN [Bacillota bacterium]